MTQNTLLPTHLINTLLQRGDHRPERTRNRFNGFGGARETVETVPMLPAPLSTPLKRGVNGSRVAPLHRAVKYSGSTVCRRLAAGAYLGEIVETLISPPVDPFSAAFNIS